MAHFNSKHQSLTLSSYLNFKIWCFWFLLSVARLDIMPDTCSNTVPACFSLLFIIVLDIHLRTFCILGKYSLQMSLYLSPIFSFDRKQYVNKQRITNLNHSFYITVNYAQKIINIKPVKSLIRKDMKVA